MAAAGKAYLLMLALLMAVAVQQMQAAPAAAAALRSGGSDWEEQRVLHPTCDHDQFMTFMRLSCQYHRRRREVRGAAAAADDGGARVARSPSPEADLFAKCCERPCNVEDFVGVCP
ncbi:hypothetical protein R5R35_013803 [Gryllus longicercus]|uniref:Uncharacterized protein n=1 Tax=Gryllus longicercus TaxID=2509291 RepID=A0AAN9ZFH5_9ORTH